MDNQTEEQWLVGISRSAKGTGLFAFPDHLSGEFSSMSNITWSEFVDTKVYGTVKKVLVSNIKYLDCVEVGARDWIIAFKWIPLTVASLNDVIASATSCGAKLCVKRCEGYGCTCIGGECK
jgi:hypothetical protein